MGAELALVLGAGGNVGLAYHAGVLLSLEHHLGIDLREADVVVGTSAGSIVAALLRRGLGAEELAAFVVGAPFRDEWLGAEHSLRVAFEQRPRRRVLNLVTPPTPGQLMRTARSFGRNRPGAVIAGMLNGAIDISTATAVLDDLGDGWPERPLRIVAVSREGRRVVFGRKGQMPRLSLAVAASCAIPGVFAPVRIDHRSYIDGGVHSPTNADVVRDLEPRQVLVVSPMSCEPATRGRRIDLPLRRRFHRRLRREVTMLEQRGSVVHVVEPETDVLSVMGLNMMDSATAIPVLREAFLATGDRIARGELGELARRPAAPASRSRG